MNALTYLLQVNLYLLLFYLFYLVLLRNETFFKLNRFYLVGSAALALFIPLLRADWIKELFVTEKVQQLAQSIEAVVTVAQTTTTITTLKAEESLLRSTEWFLIIYGLVTAVFMLNFLRKLYLLNQILKRGNKGQAFSFFNTISVDNELEGQETIMKHELVHAKQWHSADVIFFELFTAMNWFNPIAYLYKNAIKNIHEFIADETAASTLESKSAYAILLVSNVFDTQPQQLTNSFYNQSLLKRRIIMLHKTKSRKVAILKYGLSVPLFAGMVIFSSATGAEVKILNSVKEQVIPIINSLPQAELKPIEEIKVPLTTLKISPAQTKKLSLSDQVKNNQEISGTDKIKSQANQKDLEHFKDYIRAFFNKEKAKEYREYNEATVYFSFDVNKERLTGNYKIIKSTGSDWEKEMLTYMASFKDTVSLKPGTYNFFQSYQFEGNEIVEKDLKKDPHFLFGNTLRTLSTFTAADETKGAAGKIVNYIKVANLKEPIILLNGKEVNYKLTEKGFMIENTLYPKFPKITVYRGDDAVANYNESARKKGLIVLTTD